MAWGPEKDRMTNPKNQPDTKPEHPPKKDDSNTKRGLGYTAIKGSQKK